MPEEIESKDKSNITTITLIIRDSLKMKENLPLSPTRLLARDHLLSNQEKLRRRLHTDSGHLLRFGLKAKTVTLCLTGQKIPEAADLKKEQSQDKALRRQPQSLDLNPVNNHFTMK